MKQTEVGCYCTILQHASECIRMNNESDRFLVSDQVRCFLRAVYQRCYVNVDAVQNRCHIENLAHPICIIAIRGNSWKEAKQMVKHCRLVSIFRNCSYGLDDQLTNTDFTGFFIS